MKILYIYTSKDANDRKAWSGTVYRSFTALNNADFEVDYLNALCYKKKSLIDKILWRYWKFIKISLKKNIRWDESFAAVHLFRHTLKKIDYSAYDIVFVPTHIGIINALPSKIKPKIVLLTDATVDSLFNYYNEFSNLIFHNYWEAHILGKRAFNISNKIIVSSNWCKNNAIKNYKIFPDKIEVVEFGANFEMNDIPLISKSIDAKKHLNIYWSGVNWIRKGGEIALFCCDELIKRGYELTFTITGINNLPSEVLSRKYIKTYGFLDKNKKDDYLKLIEILKQQDIFLFPSKAECSSIALCEANAFGLPCFVYDTGGTSNYVKNGINGFMLPIYSNGKDFADIIEKCIKKEILNELSNGAITMYKEKLNWKIWGNKVKHILMSLK